MVEHLFEIAQIGYSNLDIVNRIPEVCFTFPFRNFSFLYQFVDDNRANLHQPQCPSRRYGSMVKAAFDLHHCENQHRIERVFCALLYDALGHVPYGSLAKFHVMGLEH